MNAIQLSVDGQGARIEAALSTPRSTGDGPVTEDEARGIVDLLDRHGFTGRSVALAAPAQLLVSNVIDKPAASDESERRAQVGETLARSHRYRPGSFEFACWPLPAQGRPGARPRLRTVACSHDDANALLDVFESSGLRVPVLDVRSSALARACVPALDDPGAAAAILDLGWLHATLLVVCDGVVIYERVLGDSGLDRLHRTLAESLELEGPVAEHLLVETGLQPRGDDDHLAVELLSEGRDLMRRYVDRVLTEVGVSLSYVAQEFPDGDTQRLLLTGDGAVIPGLDDLIAEPTGRHVSVVVPIDVVACRRSLRTKAATSRLMTALGLARRPD